MKIFTKSRFLLHCFLIGLACSGPTGVRSTTPHVRVSGRQILVDNEPFIIRGVGYSPTPIGKDPGMPSLRYDVYGDSAIRDRDFPLLKQMGCNTIRTWGKVTNHEFLKVAAEYGIHVIMGFWIDPQDFSDSILRHTLIEEFREYVGEFKDEPAVLMWAIGNEQNYDWMHRGDLKEWYTLVNEMAAAAHEIEGQNHHPVTVPNGEILNIGDEELGTDDSSLCHLDVWGANIYRGSSFYILFSEYASKSTKPFWISEYGVPALNPQSMQLDEEWQTLCDLNLWSEIASNSGICSGGTVMEYSDEWWKAGNPEVHDNDPEEWWGLFSVAKNPAGGSDILTPRKVYFKLMNTWKK